MKAYISVSFNKRKSLDKEIRAISETLNEFQIYPFVFVDRRQFSVSEERQMMAQAMKDIDDCDLLIAETSDKGIGIGIEVGYAKGVGKPVIYMRQKNAEHSTTVSGISDFQVTYSDIEDLRIQLRTVLEVIIAK